jgi:hypothetical protein
MDRESIMLMNTAQLSKMLASVALELGIVKGRHKVEPQLVDVLEKTGVVRRTGELRQGVPVCQVLIDPSYDREKQADVPRPRQRDFERDR